MGDDRILERIAAWQSAGVVDASTADRIRAAEAGTEPTARELAAPSAVSPSWFLSVGELFGYIGVGFLLAAYYWAVSKVADEPWGWAGGALVAAAAFLGVGYVVRTRGDAAGRAAGPFLLVGGFQFFVAVTFLGIAVNADTTLAPVVATLVWTAVALLARRALASLPTQLGLLAAVVGFAWVFAGWAGPFIFGTPDVQFDELGNFIGRSYSLRPVLFIIWMLAIAALLAFFGEGEARGGADDPGAGRRATLTRVWAALTAVIGTASSVLGVAGGVYGRELDPILGDGVLLVVCAALVALAIRTGSVAYLLPAGLGVVIALTDLNGQFVMGEFGLGPALLVEGLALLAAGYGTERLRRRLARRTEP